MNILIESNKMTKGSNPQISTKAQKSLFSRGLSYGLSYVKSFFHTPSTTECSCEDGDMCRNCIKKNNKKFETERVRVDNNAMLEARKAHAKADKERLEAEAERLKAERVRADNNAMLEALKAKAEEERLATEVERLKAEEHRKLDKEFELLMSAIPFIKFVSLSSSTGYPDNKCDCYGMYESDESDKKFIFFVFDGETSLIKKIDFGDSDSAPYLLELGIAGALLFNEDGTYNIIEKSTALFDIECGINNTYDHESDDE